MLEATLVSCQITPGDLIDRYSVVMVKRKKAKTTELQLSMSRRFKSLAEALETLRHDEIRYHRTMELLVHLQQIHELLWDLEDRIRNFHYPADSQDIAMLAGMISQGNLRRAQLKAAADQLWNCLPDNKEYNGDLVP